jgi:hypothetical protein
MHPQAIGSRLDQTTAMGEMRRECPREDALNVALATLHLRASWSNAHSSDCAPCSPGASAAVWSANATSAPASCAAGCAARATRVDHQPVPPQRTRKIPSCTNRVPRWRGGPDDGVARVPCRSGVRSRALGRCPHCFVSASLGRPEVCRRQLTSDNDVVGHSDRDPGPLMSGSQLRRPLVAGRSAGTQASSEPDYGAADPSTTVFRTSWR